MLEGRNELSQPCCDNALQRHMSTSAKVGGGGAIKSVQMIEMQHKDSDHRKECEQRVKQHDNIFK